MKCLVAIRSVPLVTETEIIQAVVCGLIVGSFLVYLRYFRD